MHLDFYLHESLRIVALQYNTKSITIIYYLYLNVYVNRYYKPMYIQLFPTEISNWFGAVRSRVPYKKIRPRKYCYWSYLWHQAEKWALLVRVQG